MNFAAQAQTVLGAQVRPVPVALLGAATPPGQRGFVTDSSVTLAAGLGDVVAGFGLYLVPVYSDGTNWIIG